MTRWYVIHDTSGVTLQRDVGYRSIGQGYLVMTIQSSGCQFTLWERISCLVPGISLVQD